MISPEELGEFVAWSVRSALGDLQVGDEIPRLAVLELESEGEGLWLWACRDGWTGMSTSKDGPVRCGCR